MTFKNPQTTLSALIDFAKSAGADAVDAAYDKSVSHCVSVRLQEVEDIERSENHDLGLRVMVGQRQACVSTTDHEEEALRDLAQRCVAMAKAAPLDPFCGLAPKERLATPPFEDLEMFDGTEPSTEDLTQRALICEAAAQGVNGITNSSGADAGFGSGDSWFATSDGFFGHTTGGSHSLSVCVLAGEGTNMERDYEYDSATFLSDLKSPEAIGMMAGERTIRRLNPRKINSQTAPVIFEQRLAGSLLNHLAGAINGAAIARGVSFLKNKMGAEIFPSHINVIDDPRRKRGFGSRIFDAEGVATHSRKIIDQGRLTSWLLNCAQARQLGLETTGHAGCSTGAPPYSSSTNLYLESGTQNLQALLAPVTQGLYLTDMFGPQVNSNTGDYSVGCAGFQIENGEITVPVSEITIAGNILEMFAHLDVADDLTFRGTTNAPTIKVAQMMIAGA